MVSIKCKNPFSTQSPPVPLHFNISNITVYHEESSYKTINLFSFIPTDYFIVTESEATKLADNGNIWVATSRWQQL